MLVLSPLIDGIAALQDAADQLFYFIARVMALLVDTYLMYFRVGVVWRKRRGRTPAMERRDLVMQLSPQSPYHNQVDVTTVLLHLNTAFIDRGPWKGLSASSAAPSALVTDVNYGGPGFYTALLLVLSGVNVHGVCVDAQAAQKANRFFQLAVDRQTRLHKEWVGRTGQVMLHVGDLGDLAAVVQLADNVGTDPNLRFIVACAAPVGEGSVFPPLSPQGLAGDVAALLVGPALLVLRLLSHRLAQPRFAPTAGAAWRLVFVSPAAAVSGPPPSPVELLREWPSERAMRTVLRRTGSRRVGRHAAIALGVLQFVFALARVMRQDRRLAGSCTVNAVHPCVARHGALEHTTPRLRWLGHGGYLLGSIRTLLHVSPVIAASYVADLALSKRHEHTSGHFFRMGADTMARPAAAAAASSAPSSRWRLPSLAAVGLHAPEAALARGAQKHLWDALVDYLMAHHHLPPRRFSSFE